VGRVLRAGKDISGDYRVLPEGEHAKPQFYTNKLIAEEFQAITGIEDQALRRSIERGGFENTLVDMFGEAAGRDLEEVNVLGDKDIAYSDDAVLSLINGWAKRGANKVYGDGGSKDFDPSHDSFPENMFEAMLLALPKQYFQNESEWRFYVDWEVMNKYRDLLKKRETALGDTAQTTAMSLAYKGVPVRYVPMLGRSKPLGTDGGKGDIAMLQHPDNTVWGIFHEVTIERDRIPKARKTDFVLTIEGDADYEDENAAVIAYIDMEDPAVAGT